MIPTMKHRRKIAGRLVEDRGQPGNNDPEQRHVKPVQ
jgi:hypothetical protein